MSTEEKIAAYLAGALSPAERTGFEAQCVADHSVLTELVNQRRIDAALAALLDPAQERVEAAILTTVRGRSDEVAVKQVLAKTVRAKAGRVRASRQQIRRPAVKTWAAPRPSWIPAMAITMAIVLLTVGALWWTETSRKKEGRAVVAKLRAEGGARWPASYRPLKRGQDLRMGSLILEAGVAEIEFRSGAVLVVEGPANLELVGTNRVVLREGKVAAEVPPPAHGFTVETAAGQIVDLGTRFGVKVGPDGVTETHVLEGVVDVLPARGIKGGPQRLTRDMALVVNPQTGSLTTTKFTPTSFPGPERVVTGFLKGGDFELGTALNSRGIPKGAGEWSGDPAEIVGAIHDVTPQNGEGMLRFLKVSSGKSEAEQASQAGEVNSGGQDGWRNCEQFQLIDLKTLKSLIVEDGAIAELSAWFNSVPDKGDSSAQFALAAAAFSGPPSDAKAQWSRRKELALASGEGRIEADGQAATWHRVQTRIAIPPEADFLMVSIRALKRVSPTDQEELSGDFADSVALRLVVPPRAGIDP